MEIKIMFEIRIYFSFENMKQLNEILDYVNSVLENYTLYLTTGYYKGISEPSRVIEVIFEGNYELNLIIFRDILNTIKRIAKQECVLITSKIVAMELI